MEVPSLCCWDSCPSHVHERGFCFEFEPVRTASGPSSRQWRLRDGTTRRRRRRGRERSCERAAVVTRPRAGLANSVRKECKAAGIVDTSANLWKFYVNKCRNNLHLVLAMSPSGDKLRLRCRSFPGLISNCVIDWFFAWPASVRKSIRDSWPSHDAVLRTGRPTLYLK